MAETVLTAQRTASVSGAQKARDLSVIALCGLALYGLNVDFLLFGDSALYADYALRRAFTEVVVHYGYYWLEIFAQAIAGTLFGIPIQETVVWVNVVAGTLILCVSYLLAFELLGTRRRALLLVLILGLSGRVIINATSSEMYAVQSAIILASFLLFTRNQIVLAGIVATLAMLISALSVFAFLFYPVLDYQRSGRVRWSTLLTLVAVSLVCYVPFLIVHGQQLLWGTRGLLVIAGIVKVDVPAALHNIPKYQFKQYTTMLPLLVPALLAYRRHKQFILLALAVALPHLYVITKLTGEENVFILITDFFFAGLLALGLDELWQHRYWRWAGVGAIAAHAVVLLWSGFVFSFDAHRDYDNEQRNFVQQYLAHKDAAVVTDWGTAVSMVFYGRPAMATSLVDEALFGQIYDIESVTQVNPHVLESKELYVVDRWNPRALNNFFSSKASLAEQTHENSVMEIAQRRLHITCSLMATQTNRLYRCAKISPGAGG